MRIEKVVDLGSMAVRVREMTVGDLRNLLRRGALEVDVGAFLRDGSGVPVEVIEAVTDLDHERIEALSFSELKAVIDGVKEVHAGFFDVVEAVAALAGLVDGITGRPPQPSPASNAPSSEPSEPAATTPRHGA